MWKIIDQFDNEIRHRLGIGFDNILLLGLTLDNPHGFTVTVTKDFISKLPDSICLPMGLVTIRIPIYGRVGERVNKGESKRQNTPPAPKKAAGK